MTLLSNALAFYRSYARADRTLSPSPFEGQRHKNRQKGSQFFKLNPELLRQWSRPLKSSCTSGDFRVICGLSEARKGPIHLALSLSFARAQPSRDPMTGDSKTGDQKNSYTYRDAGVDIDAGNALVKMIAPMAASTARPGADGSLGGFGGVFDLKQTGFKDPLMIAANDGVGTKLKVAISAGKHDTVGIDLVAMSVNDLIVQGGEPLFFLDYFATGKLAIEEAAAVVSGIAEGCRQAGCALVGGETAEMPGMYADGDYDLAGFAVGAVEREDLLPRKDIQEGDVLLGLASSGIHSNGYSLVRRLVDDNNLSYSDASPINKGETLGETLLTPTRIYVKSLLKAIHGSGAVKAMAHITGGGFDENIPRVLPDTLAAHIDGTSWALPAVFQWLRKLGGIELSEMSRTFNCGVGMVVVVEADKAVQVTEILQSEGETVYQLGTLKARGEGPAVCMLGELGSGA